ncbi:MAG: DNA repair protein RadC [FCB group bacterium]|nr:DNA repair protein RadC [FCB group bacterium]
MRVSNISDSELLSEYVRRFTIPAGEKIRSAKQGADHLRGFFKEGAKRELFAAVFLNNQNQLLDTEILFRGSINTSAVYPREVIERVIALGAGALILGHNHPSGNNIPSSSDRAVTKKLQTALSAIDVEVLDHIIIGGSDYFSFADHHLI